MNLPLTHVIDPNSITCFENILVPNSKTMLEQPPLFKSPIDLDFKIKTQDFLVSDDGIDDPGYSLYQFPDIEMVTVVRYESLTEVAASSPTVLSMTWNRRESWREIPIKDPLVQHAAWAYLLPGQATEGDHRKLTDGCCGFLGYLLNEVGLGSIRRLFGGDKTRSDVNGGGDDKVD